MSFSQLLVRSLYGLRLTDTTTGGFSSTSFRQYAWYPKSFKEPIYHPKDQEKLSPEDLKQLAHEKFLPAWSRQNASVFHDPILAKFTNHVMKGGRKQKAREIINRAFEKIKRKQIRKYHLAETSEDKQSIKTNPLEIFHEAINNCRPLLDITEVKRGGVLYKVPIAIEEHKSYFKSMKWMIEAARDAPRRTAENDKWGGEHFADRLARELLEASNSTGKVVKKKLEFHKIAEANKAYAHFRWS